MAKLLKNLFVLGMALFMAPAARAVNLSVVTNFLKQKFAKPVTNGVGVIKITGDLDRDSVEKVIRKVLNFAEDGNIKGVLLVVNSGGGEGGVSELLYREIKALSQNKPVVSLAAQCLSGAYFAASGSHWIVAPSVARIGSIGNWIMVEKQKNVKLNNKWKAEVSYEMFIGGKFKAMTHPNGKQLNEEHRAAMQAEVNAGYEAFCSFISQERKLPIKQCPDWADGKVFLGKRAKELGLIDQVGGYSDAVKKLKELMKERGSLVDGKINFIE